MLWPMAIGLASWADLGVETIAKTRLKVPFRKDISAMSAIAKQKPLKTCCTQADFNQECK